MTLILSLSNGNLTATINTGGDIVRSTEVDENGDLLYTTSPLASDEIAVECTDAYISDDGDLIVEGDV